MITVKKKGRLSAKKLPKVYLFEDETDISLGEWK